MWKTCSLVTLRVAIACLVALAYCEFVIYYVVIAQCKWPELEETVAAADDSAALRAMFLADTHLLGPYRGHWFDKLKREWQMHRAFQTSMHIYEPEAVFILGDLFDEGLWCTWEEFDEYGERFRSLFRVPDTTRLFAVPGNHDLGFHYRLRGDLTRKFNRMFNATSVQLVNLKGNYFVLVNSMALHGDRCHFCHEADARLRGVAEKMKCLKLGRRCPGVSRGEKYSRPIFVQHFPMYRKSDEMCEERDRAPPKLREQPFRERWECLSKEASEMIYDLLEPRIILTGHTHHGCRVRHREDIDEHTLSSFSWRNKNDPTFVLGVFSPNNSALARCDLPRESTTIFIYFLCAAGSLVYIACVVHREYRHKEKTH